MRLGLPRRFPPRSLQQLPRKVHQVRLLRPLLLPQQVHLPLSSNQPVGQVRAAGRRQLQLVASSHETLRESAGRGGARVGGREGHVQWRHQETIAQQQSRVQRVAESGETAEIVADDADTEPRPVADASASPAVPGIAAPVVQKLGHGLRLASASTGRRCRSRQDAWLPLLAVRSSLAGQERTGPISWWVFADFPTISCHRRWMQERDSKGNDRFAENFQECDDKNWRNYFSIKRLS